MILSQPTDVQIIQKLLSLSTMRYPGWDRLRIYFFIQPPTEKHTVSRCVRPLLNI